MAQAHPLRWVVRPGDGDTVGEVLARAGADGSAVADGRVFLGRLRVRRPDEAVRPGEILHVAPARAAAGAPVRVLARADDLIAVDKPAGIPTIPDQSGSSHSLIALVAAELRVDPARVHPTSRLDRDVSGVVVLALTREAAARLSAARARGDYERRYLAIATRAPEPDRGAWTAPIGRAKDPRLRAVGGRDAVEARTRYAAVAGAPGGQRLLAVAPVTGRTHQIRLHASHARAPLLGDRSYGGPVRLVLPTGRVLEPRRIALHAARVVVPDARGASVVAASPVPVELEELWSALGGDPEAWQLGLSCELV
jgi:23S rRNA-/tRNA-specific pseudouridylate synthase